MAPALLAASRDLLGEAGSPAPRNPIPRRSLGETGEQLSILAFSGTALMQIEQQAANDLQLQGQRKQRDFQRLGQDLQEEVEAERQEILSRTSQRMVGVVKKLADARGMDIVVDSSGTLFFKAALDLTKDALAEYDRAFPVK